MGYIDGANLYEYVKSDPEGKIDPMGRAAEPAKGAVSGEFTLLDADFGDNLKDPQGTMHLELTATNMPQANETLKLIIKASFKLSAGIDTTKLDSGALYVDGEKSKVTAKDAKQKTSTNLEASKEKESKTNEKCGAAGTIYVALHWKGAVNPDPDEKNPNSGVAQSYKIDWKYDPEAGLTGKIKEFVSEPRNLPIDKPPSEEKK